MSGKFLLDQKYLKSKTEENFMSLTYAFEKIKKTMAILISAEKLYYSKVAAIFWSLAGLALLCS